MSNSYVRKKAFNKIKSTILEADDPVPFLKLSVKVYEEFGFTDIYTKKTLKLLEDAEIIEQVEIDDKVYYKKVEEE